MSRYCTGCGQQLEDGVRFCTACGAALSSAAASPGPPVIPSSGKSHPWRKAALIAGMAIVAVSVGVVGIALLPSAGPGGAPGGAGPAWILKAGDGQSLYAVASPKSSTLNVRAVVLACEVAGSAKVLNLQVYAESEGPLLPRGARREDLKDEPALRLEVDGVELPAKLFFAGDFAVIADQLQDNRPLIGAALGNALEQGKSLNLQFDLLRSRGGPSPNAVVVVDLKSTGGAEAIGAVRRRCGQ